MSKDKVDIKQNINEAFNELYTEVEKLVKLITNDLLPINLITNVIPTIKTIEDQETPNGTCYREIRLLEIEYVNISYDKYVDHKPEISIALAYYNHDKALAAIKDSYTKLENRAIPFLKKQLSAHEEALAGFEKYEGNKLPPLENMGIE